MCKILKLKTTVFFELYQVIFMQIISVLVVASLGGFLVITFVPSILDVIVPMNTSRPRQLPVIVEYFIDEEIYFLAILIHIIVTNFAGGVTVAAIGTMNMAYALHTCAMFKIAR